MPRTCSWKMVVVLSLALLGGCVHGSANKAPVTPEPEAAAVGARQEAPEASAAIKAPVEEAKRVAARATKPTRRAVKEEPRRPTPEAEEKGVAEKPVEKAAVEKPVEKPVEKAAAAEVVPYESSMARPEKVSGPEPQYTPEAVAQRVQGLFIARCTVTLEGQVENCRVLKPLPHLTEALLETLKQQRYRPALREGRPVAVDYPFSIRMTLPR